MKKYPVLLTILFILCSLTPSNAKEKVVKKGPGITMGITTMLGTSNIQTKDSAADVAPGYIVGGGILLEKVLTDHFAVGTGVQYRYFENDFTVKDMYPVEVDASWNFSSISVPFHLIASIKGPVSSINILAGAVYTHIYSSQMKTGTTLPTGETKDDAMRFINASQVGVSGGVIFRFLVTEYSDFFMGVITEYYPTNLLANSKESESLHLLNYSFNTGYMFRTDLFGGK